MEYSRLAFENIMPRFINNYEIPSLYSLENYISPNALQALEEGYHHKEQNATVLYADLRNYTVLVSHYSAKEILEFLDEYFNLMSKEIYAHNGLIDEFTGDQILAFFGTKEANNNGALDAIMAGLSMQEANQQLLKYRQEQNLPALEMGIGINSGKLVFGNIGNSLRREVTAVGNVMNSAFRIEKLNKTLETQILIGDGAFSTIKDYIHYRFMGTSLLRGFALPQPIYEVLGLNIVNNAN